MNRTLIRSQFRAVMDDIEERSCVTEKFVDRDLYRLYVATLWANVVLNPADAGLTEPDLEPLHDYLNERMATVLGADTTLRDCFAFVSSPDGEQAMRDARLNQTHRELLLFFASMILDPEGHQRWLEQIRHSDTRL